MVLINRILTYNTRNILFGCLLYILLSSILFSSQAKAQGKLKKKIAASTPAIREEVYQIIVRFYQYDKSLPLFPQIIDKQDLPEGKKEKIIFTGVNNSRVPAYLALPKTGVTPFPVVILIDGITGSKDRWFIDNSWPKGGLISRALLQAGYAVLTLDAVHHGERTAENNFSPLPFPWTAPYAFANMVRQTTIEHRRAIDYLGTRSDIDTTRIGVLGLSMGGMITFALSSLDNRIKTVVAGLTPTIKQPEVMPVVAPTFAPHVKTASFLMFMGTKDNYYTMEEAKQLFNLIPVQNKEFIAYEVGHEPPAEYVAKVTEWFKMHLKP